MAVVDDGMRRQHGDLGPSRHIQSRDFVDLGGIYHPYERHGTAIVGIIAERDNSMGMRGEAPRTTIDGYKLLPPGHLGRWEGSYVAECGYLGGNQQPPVEGGIGSPELGPSMWEEILEHAVTTGLRQRGRALRVVGRKLGRGRSYSTPDERKDFHAVTSVRAVSVGGCPSCG